MIKFYCDGKIRYSDKAVLLCGPVNSVKIAGFEKEFSPSEFGLHIKNHIFDRDIVEFIDSSGTLLEGVVLRNYRNTTTVIECPKYGKRVSLRSVSDTVNTKGSALDPECEDVYKVYKSKYSPVTEARFNIKRGSKKYSHIVKEDFRIDLVTNKLITCINASNFGSSTKRNIPLAINKNDYGLRFGNYFERDIVEIRDNETRIPGEIVADEYGCYIKAGEKKLPVLGSSISYLGSAFVEVINKSTKAPAISYEIYTDGSALSNPGPCGFGYIITKDGEIVRENATFIGDGTNNIAELTAVKEALLDAINDSPNSITIYSDSKYCIDGINCWSKSWLKNGYKTIAGEEIANVQLWKEIIELIERLKETINLKFKWVKGHSNNKFNNKCDSLAKGVITEAFI